VEKRIGIFFLMLLIKSNSAFGEDFSQKLYYFLPTENISMTAHAINKKTGEQRFIDYAIHISESEITTTYILKKRLEQRGIQIEQVSSRVSREVKTSLILPPTNIKKPLRDKAYKILDHNFEPALLSFFWLESLELELSDMACMSEKCVVFSGFDESRKVVVEFSRTFDQIQYVSIFEESLSYLEVYFFNYRRCNMLNIPHTIILKNLDAGDMEINLSCPNAEQ